MSLVTLDNVVRNVMVDLGEQSLNKYQTYLQWAIRGFRELKLHNSSYAKIAYLPISNSKSVDLPIDYLKYTKIGVCINDRVVLLGLDDTLCVNHKKDDCGNPLELALNPATTQDTILGLNYGYYFFDHYRNGQFVGGLYGLGGGDSSLGYYRINEEKNQIQLTSQVPSTEIILEYISDGSDTTGTATVPKYAVEALIQWVHWQRLRRMSNKTRESEIARRDYIIEFDKLKHFKLMFTAAEYLQMLRSNIHSAPKR